MADVKNTEGSKAGFIATLLFLGQFGGDMPWVHLDIAYTSVRDKESRYQIKRATGEPVRALINLALVLDKGLDGIICVD